MRCVVYPGTFDPMTFGHMDIACRAEQLFDRVIIAIAEGSHKHTLLSLEERVTLGERLFKNHKKIIIKPFHGLLVNFLHQEKTNVIIRGIRNALDYTQEWQLASMNVTLNPSTETIFLATKANYACISSSIVRDIIRKKQDASAFVPPIVNEFLKNHTHE